MFTDNFFISAGSVAGTDHKKIGKNNQDGLAVSIDGRRIVAVVCDGCSSSLASEVGAKFIARFVADEMLSIMNNCDTIYLPSILPELRDKTLKLLKNFSESFQNPLRIAEEMLLATIVGAAINEFMTMVFTIGDGVVSVNGNVRILDEKNLPPYIGYEIFPDRCGFDKEKLDFQVQEKILTENLQSLIIATDGAAKIQEKAGELLWVAGEDEKVKGLVQFEEEERYLKNHFNLQRRLGLFNLEKTIIDWKAQKAKKFQGILNDDTTIVLIRRR